MAISTDQIVMELKKTKISNAQQAANKAVPPSLILSRLISTLQTTISLEELLPMFSAELSCVVDHSGFKFNHEEHNIHMQSGLRSNHSCEYTLAIENNFLGKITFMRRKRFNEKELETIESFLSALLYPLKNTLLYRLAIQAAHTDSLTGVLNRSTLQSVFQKESSLARRHQSDLSLVMIDIDFFKKVNDSYGHAAGDLALKELTDCIQRTVRESDHIFRLGGEEFAILLNNIDLKGAALLAERLHNAVQQISIEHEDQEFGFTISAGVTQYNDNEALDELMNRADKALYEAKDGGRNKVVTN